MDADPFAAHQFLLNSHSFVEPPKAAFTFLVKFLS